MAVNLALIADDVRASILGASGDCAPAWTGYFGGVARDEEQHEKDLDWLYGRAPSTADETSILPEAEPTPAPRAAHAPEPASRVLFEREVPAAQPAPAPAPRPAPAVIRSTPRPRSRRLPRFIRWIVALLAAWLVFTIATPIVALGRMTTLKIDVPGLSGIQPGAAFLLVGTDTREGLTEQEKQELGTGSAAGTRTDTIIIFFVPLRGDPVLISVPRDSYLPIPGHGKNKINAAYSMGGPGLLVQTVEENTGLDLDGYIEIGFAGFADIIDAVGGVEVCPEKPMKDPLANLDIPAGCQTLDGPTALGYVRTRKYDPQGDIARAGRQREVISKVAAKAASPATVINPVRWWNLNMAVSGALQRGDNTSGADVFPAAKGMLGFNSAISLTVPTKDTNATTPAGSSVLWDEQRAAEMFAQLAKGNTDGMEQYK